MERPTKFVTQNNMPPDCEARPQYCRVLSLFHAVSFVSGNMIGNYQNAKITTKFGKQITHLSHAQNQSCHHRIESNTPKALCQGDWKNAQISLNKHTASLHTRSCLAIIQCSTHKLDTKHSYKDGKHNDINFIKLTDILFLNSHTFIKTPNKIIICSFCNMTGILQNQKNDLFYTTSMVLTCNKFSLRKFLPHPSLGHLNALFSI
jgi:hypothetical protein